MAAFDYVALDTDGRRRKGVISAETARAARKELRARSLTPLNVDLANAGQSSAAGGGKGRARIATGDLVLTTRQLAMLLRAGSPVEEALGAVATQAESRSVRAVMHAVRTDVAEGRRLSEALARHPKSFSALFRAMVSAGETSGELGVVMERLAELLENAQTLRRKVISAVIYPAVLAVVAMTVVTALMVFVVPKVVEQFASVDQALPLLTRIVIGTSSFLQSYGLILLVIGVLGSIAFGRLMMWERARRRMDKIVLRLPIIGRLTRAVAAARFARTFSALVASGATVIDSLQASKHTVGNLVVRDAVEDIVTAVTEGSGMSAAMRASGAFPSLLSYLAHGGERSGELASMFEKGAEYLENEFETATAIALNLLEPGIIVLMGGLVACIVMAIMLPILQLNSLALM